MFGGLYFMRLVGALLIWVFTGFRDSLEDHLHRFYSLIVGILFFGILFFILYLKLS
ncbi:hypothetical protein JM79_2161 [Gramella sp. Hel_I_59]|nr:hypothetical protein JM79_2161 [Gramella sp. Hel_I_59]